MSQTQQRCISSGTSLSPTGCQLAVHLTFKSYSVPQAQPFFLELLSQNKEVARVKESKRQVSEVRLKVRHDCVLNLAKHVLPPFLTAVLFLCRLRLNILIILSGAIYQSHKKTTTTHMSFDLNSFMEIYSAKWELCFWKEVSRFHHSYLSRKPSFSKPDWGRESFWLLMHRITVLFKEE